MTAKVIQIRDGFISLRSAKVIQIRDFHRKEEKLKQQAAEILSQIDTGPSEMIPYHGAGIDGIPYQAPDKDPA